LQRSSLPAPAVLGQPRAKPRVPLNDRVGAKSEAVDFKHGFRSAPIPAVRVIGGCRSTLSCYRLADNRGDYDLTVLGYRAMLGSLQIGLTRTSCGDLPFFRLLPLLQWDRGRPGRSKRRCR